MKEAHRIHQQTHFSLKLRSMRSDYNCIGLVFGSRRTALSIDDALQILDDDGYRPISREDSERGDLVLYEDAKGPVHIGIIWDSDPIRKTLTVLSAWGSDGEYFHSLEDVRDDWKHEVSIWTERLIYK